MPALRGFPPRIVPNADVIGVLWAGLHSICIVKQTFALSHARVIEPAARSVRSVFDRGDDAPHRS